MIDVHISSSGPTLHSPKANDPSQPCGKYITYRPIISSIRDDVVTFEDGTELKGVQTILFATGYNFALPFCKRTDAPWGAQGTSEADGLGNGSENGERPKVKARRTMGAGLLDGTIRPEEWPEKEVGSHRDDGAPDEVGGIRGLQVNGLDPLMLFLEGDRTFALPALRE